MPGIIICNLNGIMGRKWGMVYRNIQKSLPACKLLSFPSSTLVFVLVLRLVSKGSLFNLCIHNHKFLMHKLRLNHL